MRIEIWSDIVCPWCYIGKRRLEAALSRFPRRGEVEVIYRSFELDPGAPAASEKPLDQALAEKYGVGLAGARAMMARVAGVAAEEGLRYDFSIAKRGNSFDAHRLLHLAAERGRQAEMAERLFSAYFSEGAPISDRAALSRLAGEVGLDAEEGLAGGAYNEAVRADEERARALGITGVPFFLIDGRLGLSGAQPADAILSALTRASEGRGAEGPS